MAESADMTESFQMFSPFLRTKKRQKWPVSDLLQIGLLKSDRDCGRLAIFQLGHTLFSLLPERNKEQNVKLQFWVGVLRENLTNECVNDKSCIGC